MKHFRMPMLLILVMTALSANAQLLNSVKKVAKAADVAQDGVKVAKAVSKKAGKGGSSGSAGLKLDWNTFNMTPAITFNSLLYGTQIFTNGHTRFESYTATFIPHKKAGGGDVSTTSEQDQFLKVKVYKDDQYLNYFEYDGHQTFEEGKKTKFNAPSSRYQRDGEWVGDTDIFTDKAAGPGKYRLDFYAGDKMFYSFDFEVYKITNNDPYAAMNEMYLSRGPWNDYAYMNYADTGNLVFGFYLNHEDFQPDKANSRKTNKAVKWGVKLLKDGKPYAQHYGNGMNEAQVKQAEWSDFSCAFKLVDKPGEVKFASLPDAAYKVELTIAGEKKPRIYNFNVKGGRIVQSAEQDRTKNTDPTRLIEGWNDFFWMKLEK